MDSDLGELDLLAMCDINLTTGGDMEPTPTKQNSSVA